MHDNIILIQLTEKKYIFVGLIVYEFTSETEIIDYISSMGNNDVSYPIAYDGKNIYFMVDQVYDKIDNFKTQVSVANAEDIYFEFYGPVNGTPHIGNKMNNFEIINERYEDYNECECE